MLEYKGMFGMKFPDKISIAKRDEEYAEKKVPEFFVLWNRDKELREKIFKVYKYKLFKNLICYVNTTKLSSINFEKKFILLSMYASSISVPTIIIHEFSHIAFLAKWKEFCKKTGYSDEGIQELKEVLTVINNIEYKNINDNGYPVHKNIRETVKNMWLEKYDLAKIISDPKIINLINSLNTIQKCRGK